MCGFYVLSACLSWVQPSGCRLHMCISRCVCVCACADVYMGDGASPSTAVGTCARATQAPGQSSPETMILQPFIVLQ